MCHTQVGLAVQGSKVGVVEAEVEVEVEVEEIHQEQQQEETQKNEAME